MTGAVGDNETSVIQMKECRLQQPDAWIFTHRLGAKPTHFFEILTETEQVSVAEFKGHLGDGARAGAEQLAGFFYFFEIRPNWT